MKIPDLVSNDLRLAIEAAQHANQVVMQGFQSEIVAESKGQKGLVTAFDKQAEQVIIASLRAKSAYSILGEEGGLNRQDDSSLVWVVDPIDGTTNFSRKLPLFAISIALLKDNEVKLGVVLNPTSNDCYFAERGQGAYKNGQKISVSSNENPTNAIVLLSHGYQADDLRRMAELVGRLGGRYHVRTLGTTALELCLVADGLADAFICSGDELWDYAAGVLLVQEAGGSFTDWRGEQWDGQHSFVFASNGRLHERLLEDIGDLQG